MAEIPQHWLGSGSVGEAGISSPSKGYSRHSRAAKVAANVALSEDARGTAAFYAQHGFPPNKWSLQQTNADFNFAGTKQRTSPSARNGTAGLQTKKRPREDANMAYPRIGAPTAVGQAALSINPNAELTKRRRVNEIQYLPLPGYIGSPFNLAPSPAQDPSRSTSRESESIGCGREAPNIEHNAQHPRPIQDVSQQRRIITLKVSRGKYLQLLLALNSQANSDKSNEAATNAPSAHSIQMPETSLYGSNGIAQMGYHNVCKGNEAATNAPSVPSIQIPVKPLYESNSIAQTGHHNVWMGNEAASNAPSTFHAGYAPTAVNGNNAASQTENPFVWKTIGAAVNAPWPPPDYTPITPSGNMVIPQAKSQHGNIISGRVSAQASPALSACLSGPRTLNNPVNQHTVRSENSVDGTIVGTRFFGTTPKQVLKVSSHPPGAKLAHKPAHESAPPATLKQSNIKIPHLLPKSLEDVPKRKGRPRKGKDVTNLQGADKFMYDVDTVHLWEMRTKELFMKETAKEWNFINHHDPSPLQVAADAIPVIWQARSYFDERQKELIELAVANENAKDQYVCRLKAYSPQELYELVSAKAIASSHVPASSYQPPKQTRPKKRKAQIENPVVDPVSAPFNYPHVSDQTPKQPCPKKRKTEHTVQAPAFGPRIQSQHYPGKSVGSWQTAQQAILEQRKPSNIVDVPTINKPTTTNIGGAQQVSNNQEAAKLQGGTPQSIFQPAGPLQTSGSGVQGLRCRKILQTDLGKKRKFEDQEIQIGSKTSRPSEDINGSAADESLPKRQKTSGAETWPLRYFVPPEGCVLAPFIDAGCINSDLGLLDYSDCRYHSPRNDTELAWLQAAIRLTVRHYIALADGTDPELGRVTLDMGYMAVYNDLQFQLKMWARRNLTARHYWNVVCMPTLFKLDKWEGSFDGYPNAANYGNAEKAIMGRIDRQTYSAKCARCARRGIWCDKEIRGKGSPCSGCSGLGFACMRHDRDPETKQQKKRETVEVTAVEDVIERETDGGYFRAWAE